MILDQFPHVTNQAFKQKHKAIKWPSKASHFKAWCEGQTGYPIIDAAMRHFNQTGWMHNRLRMVVASFLVKDLLIDWRKGEYYFARYLLDYDLAANNGGWQWCASTGCDAQPYFRIFNPENQSRKFDPQGDFIRKYIPKLKDLSDRWIHAPSKAPKTELKNFRLGRNYPYPIVDHHEQTQLAISLYK